MSRLSKPKTIKHLGTSQGGDLQHVNPLSIAMWEVRYIWPDRGEPDFVLSLGTGTYSKQSLNAKTASKSPVKDKFFARLYTTLMRNVDGEQGWQALLNTIPESSRGRYHRMNMPLQGEQTEIDDVRAMHALKQQTINYLACTRILEPASDSMYASIFYFELEDMPVFNSGLYTCIGHIFCRLRLSQHGRRILYHQLATSKAYFVVLGHPVICVDPASRSAPFFKRRIRFTVPNMSDIVGITLRGFTSEPRSISGLPQSLENIITRQRLNAPFGSIDHRSPEKALPSLPVKRKLAQTESGFF